MKKLLIVAISLASVIVHHQAATAQGIVVTLPAEPVTDWSNDAFWETVDGRPISDSWDFAQGEIRLARPRGDGGSLLSPPLSPNFQLTWEWKIASRTNTGLKYRVRRFGKSLFNNKPLGIEYQIIDDKATSQSKSSTASIYDLVAPAAKETLRAPGEWNHSRIVADGDRIEHYLNGQLVASAETIGPGWETAIALSKFFGSVDFGRPKTGDRIMLTDHGGEAAFRNFQFQPLNIDSASRKVIEQRPPFLGNAMRNSWADQESIVIWTRTTARPEMVSDGPRFKEISKKQAAKLAKLRDPRELLRIQIPNGAKLDEIYGACPGSPGRVRLSYFPVAKRNAVKHTPWETTSVENDYAVQWKLDGLRPGTKYAVVVQAKSAESDEPTAVVRGRFQTAPKAGAKRDVKFCMTTCHDFIRRDDGDNGHKIYPAMTAMAPDFVIHAGDIEYYDKPDPWALTIDLMRFKWQRIFALPNNREFYSDTTTYFLKDDHDTLTNDCWPGQMYGAVSFAQGVKLFNEEQFPSHTPRYKTIRWSKDLQIWLLEGRDFRSPNNMPDGPEKTILGDEQKTWLFSTLADSTAKFKVVVSPTPIVGPDRNNKKDNHANDVFEYEGNEIRAQLAAIENLIVLCGDRHWQYASMDEKTGLWEFGCGPGSEKHQLGWKPGDKRPVHRFLRVKGGYLSGHLTYPLPGKEPRLTIRHHGVTGKAHSLFQFPLADANPADPANKPPADLPANAPHEIRPLK